MSNFKLPDNKLLVTILYFMLLSIAVASNLYIIYLVGMVYSFGVGGAGESNYGLTTVSLQCLASFLVLGISGHFWRQLERHPLVWKARWLHMFGIAFLITSAVSVYVAIETEPPPPDAQTTLIVNKAENRQGGYFELRDDPPSGNSNFIYAVSGEDFRTYAIGDRYYIPVDTIDRDTQPSNELVIIGVSAGIFAVLFLGSFWRELRRRSKTESA